MAAANVQSSCALKPLVCYTWLDNDRNLHLLNCGNPNGKSPTCACKDVLDRIIKSDEPFLLLKISCDGTHEASCSKEKDFCSCHLNGYFDYIKVKDVIHKKECLIKECDGSCAKDITQSTFHIPQAMPKRDSLWWNPDNDFLHLTSCTGLLPCMCTFKLFKCGYYNVRFSRHGPHLTQCMLSIDSPPDATTLCKCKLIFREHYKWPSNSG
ncbi:hypothetical protein JTE90_022638 [Oedothorax gibbosus]|uniref:Uncharacterized protein n=1 Tax=Oedothorax gibbosus TaxID=931172 RepID=A0AAV6TT92_9ARAC|nr:hypothetical protein JTE90_022638 [Oedothorax gibbosus]